jgi:hypothetical protein
MDEYFTMTNSVEGDYTCSSVATSGSVGSNPVTHTSANEVSISTTSVFSGSIEISCTHNTDSTVTATHTMPLTIDNMTPDYKCYKNGGTAVKRTADTNGLTTAECLCFCKEE